MNEITYEELNSLDKDSFALIDIRDEGLRAVYQSPTEDAALDA